MQNLFQTQLARGEYGEQIFMERMKMRGNQYEDLRHQKEWQQKDVDFKVINTRKETTYVEVKTDYRMNSTGNIFLESHIDYCRGGSAPGWFAYTSADFLAFVDGKSRDKDIYIYKTSELRDWVRLRKPALKCCNDGFKKVYGYCIPRDAVFYQKV